MHIRTLLYNDIRLNEFYMLDAENNILYPKRALSERTEVDLKRYLTLSLPMRTKYGQNRTEVAS